MGPLLPVANHRNRRLIWATGVLVLAAVLRLWQINSAPPGLHEDEAFHLLNAEKIIRGEAFPVFITANNGYEALIVYLVAIPLTILGPVAWAGRLAAAWGGLLGVALTMRAGDEVFRKRPVGILAGLVLATLFWHLDFSRFGSQPILATAAAAGVMAALWRGARTGSRRAYALAGLSLGLGLNAYLAFRLFPAAALGAGLALLAARRGRRLPILAGGLLAGGVAALVFAPLALFFIQNPAWFFQRFDETTAQTLGAANARSAVLTNVLKTLGGLFVEGDSNWRHNLAGRPALDAAQALFFLVGIGICLRQWRRPESWALLIWLVVGLSPSMLTISAPHFGRTTMVLPAIALLVALGITTLWGWAHGRAARGLLVTVLVLSPLLTVYDFFGRWAHDPHLFEFFEVQQTWIARALETEPPGTLLYATPLHIANYQNLWPIEFLLGRETYRRFSSYNGQLCTVLPARPAAGAAYAVVIPDDPNTPAALEAAFADVTHRTVASLAGAPYLDLYEIPPGEVARVQVATLRQADFGGLVRLVGYTLPPDGRSPGDLVRLTIVWEADQVSQIPYKLFIHLIGPPKADGSLIYTQRDEEPCADSYPTWQWHPGDLIIETYSLMLPADMPAGNYVLQTGWYLKSSPAERLPAFDAAGQSLGDAVHLEAIAIHSP